MFPQPVCDFVFNEAICIGQLTPWRLVQILLRRALGQGYYTIGWLFWPTWNVWSRQRFKALFLQEGCPFYSLWPCHQRLCDMSAEIEDGTLLNARCLIARVPELKQMDLKKLVRWLLAVSFFCIWIYCSLELNSFRCISCRWRTNRGNASLEYVQLTLRRNKAVKWKIG